MAALPYIQLYVSDYLADTAHLSAAQHGAYLLLIFNYWQRGQALCNTNERLANVARMSSEEWSANRVALAEFFEIDGDIWRHRRIETDLAAVATKSTRAREAGLASAAKRAIPAPHALAGRTKGTSASVQRLLNPTDTETETETEAEKKGRAARATRLPADWTPSPDAIAFCHSERPDLDAQDMASRFRDYWCAVAGEKGRKVDWDATWRNWVRNEKARQIPAQVGTHLGNAGQSTKYAALDWLGATP
jgi:uncharacterized protein YdaU (DUF1376 family)